MLPISIGGYFNGNLSLEITEKVKLFNTVLLVYCYMVIIFITLNMILVLIPLLFVTEEDKDCKSILKIIVKFILVFLPYILISIVKNLSCIMVIIIITLIFTAGLIKKYKEKAKKDLAEEKRKEILINILKESLDEEKNKEKIKLLNEKLYIKLEIPIYIRIIFLWLITELFSILDLLKGELRITEKILEEGKGISIVVIFLVVLIFIKSIYNFVILCYFSFFKSEDKKTHIVTKEEFFIYKSLIEEILEDNEGMI